MAFRYLRELNQDSFPGKLEKTGLSDLHRKPGFLCPHPEEGLTHCSLECFLTLKYLDWYKRYSDNMDVDVEYEYIWIFNNIDSGIFMKPIMIILVTVLILSGCQPTRNDQADPSRTSPLFLIDTHTPQGLQELFNPTSQSLCLISAHRGGARPHFPENCIETFENTLQHTFAIMETDPRYTKEGAIVVHHDPTLDRTTTGRGLVAEMTLPQLKALRLKDSDGNITDFQIPTLDEVITWAKGKTILVLDQKDVPVEVRVKKIEEHQAEAWVMVIVYNFDDARTCYRLNKNIMMEVMIPDRQKFNQFDITGIPWRNIIAFVGHTPPADKDLIPMIHAKGACCMAGTSRNIDKELSAGQSLNTRAIEQKYQALQQLGVNIIETDLPTQVGPLLFNISDIPTGKSKFFIYLP